MMTTIYREFYGEFYKLLYKKFLEKDYHVGLQKPFLNKLRWDIWTITQDGRIPKVKVLFAGANGTCPIKYFYNIYLQFFPKKKDPESKYSMDRLTLIKALVYCDVGKGKDVQIKKRKSASEEERGQVEFEYRKVNLDFDTFHKQQNWSQINTEDMAKLLIDLFTQEHMPSAIKTSPVEPPNQEPNETSGKVDSDNLTGKPINKIKKQHASIDTVSSQNEILAKSKLRKPPPDQHFRKFVFGRLEIPVSSVACCPEKPYRIVDVVVRFKDEFVEDRPDYPVELKAAKQDLLNYTVKAFKVGKYEPNVLYRLDHVEHEPEDQQDNRGKLVLHFSKTRYDNMMATNMAIDAMITPEKSVRQKYGHLPYNDLSRSILSNPPGVECVVISTHPAQDPQRQVIIRKRSLDVVCYRGFYQVSASGYISLSHKDNNGIPSPFVTASRETMQEASGFFLDTEPEDFNLLGVAIHWHGLYPNLIGYFETNKPVVEILGDPKRDGHEGEIEAIPFTIESVINHLGENHWTPMSAYAMIMVLCAMYPVADVKAAADKIAKPKLVDDFWIN